MPWMEVNPVDSKVLFIGDWLRKLYSFAELCRKHGISRKTGYKWVKRYRDDAAGWLRERTRRPKHSPLSVPKAIRREVLALRKLHKDWGAKKISAWLSQKVPEWETPSVTTIYKILRSEGLVAGRKRRRRVPPPLKPFAPVNGCNDLWTADFKGQFEVGDGTVCYPLTVMDHASRYLLACVILPGTRYEDTKREFERLFVKYGLPGRIRTDNGTPFASTSVGGLSRLSVWWLKMGIVPERIERGHPEQNGQHERMHRTLKKATVIPPAQTVGEQQKRFDRFRQEYNEERPHESLEQKPPSSLYKPSEKKMDGKGDKNLYPAQYVQALVSHNGCICHKGRYVYIGYLLKGEKVGLEEVEEERWEVYFRTLRLGRFREESPKASGSCTALENV